MLVLSLVAAIAIYPILFMGLSSFKTSFEYLADPIGLPSGFSYVDNFVAVYYRFNLPRLFFNTVWYILLASALTLASRFRRRSPSPRHAFRLGTDCARR